MQSNETHCCPEALAQAQASLQRRAYAEVTTLCEELLSEHPTCFDALRLGGSTWLLRGEPRRAIPLLTRALQQQPESVEVLNDLGLAHQAGVRYRKLLRCCARP